MAAPVVRRESAQCLLSVSRAALVASFANPAVLRRLVLSLLLCVQRPSLHLQRFVCPRHRKKGADENCAGSSFYYPPYTIWLELTVTATLGIVQWARLFLGKDRLVDAASEEPSSSGSKSNKTEMMRPMIWSLLLTPAAATTLAYFLALQIYV